jgi:hypothetical protein
VAGADSKTSANPGVVSFPSTTVLTSPGNATSCTRDAPARIASATLRTGWPRSMSSRTCSAASKAAAGHAASTIATGSPTNLTTSPASTGMVTGT